MRHKALGHCWTGNFSRGKGFSIFFGDFLGEKQVIPEAVHQLLHKVSAFQSHPFEPMTRPEKILRFWDEHRGLSHKRHGDSGDENSILSYKTGNLRMNPGRFPSQSFYCGWEQFGPLYLEN